MCIYNGCCKQRACTNKIEMVRNRESQKANYACGCGKTALANDEILEGSLEFICKYHMCVYVLTCALSLHMPTSRRIVYILCARVDLSGRPRKRKLADAKARIAISNGQAETLA